MIEEQERGQWTSASSAQADALCVGRHRAQSGLPDTTSKDADFGNSVHAALAKQDSTGLTVEEEDIYESCMAIEAKLLVRFFGPEVEGLKPSPIRERRYWVHWPDGLKHSGQVDCVHRKGTRALIIEYKALPGAKPASPLNMQLRDQVCVVSANTELLSEVGVAVIQPLVTHTPEITVYDKTTISRSNEQLYLRVEASNNGGPRTAGEIQCQFCKARTMCAEYAVFAASKVPMPANLVDVPVAVWTPEMRRQFCDSFDIAQKWLNGCWAEMERGAETDPEFVPGYSLQEGTPREKVVNLQAVFDRASTFSIPLETFLNKSTISKKDLNEITRLYAKVKGKKLAETVEVIIGDDVAVSDVKKSLKPIKP